eukprot:gene20204-26225_t
MTKSNNKRSRPIPLDKDEKLQSLTDIVFHLDCLRPKLAIVPKGRWSCAYCVVDDTVKGDIEEAKKSINLMKKHHSASDTNNNIENFITKLNKKFLVEQSNQDITKEIGRFDTLEAALESIAENSTKKIQSPFTKAKHRNQYSKPLPVDDDDEDGLWCIYCLDDPNVTICSFCGCRICFGKHDSKYLLLCDDCDQEAHTYCLNPPLVEIPEGAWFCEACSKKRNKKQSSKEIDNSISKNIISIKLPEKIEQVNEVPVSPVVVKSKVLTPKASPEILTIPVAITADPILNEINTSNPVSVLPINDTKNYVDELDFQDDGSQSMLSVDNSSLLDGSNQSVSKGRRGRPKGSFKSRGKVLNNIAMKEKISRDIIGTRLRTNINRGISSMGESVYSLDETEDDYNEEIIETIIPSIDNAISIAKKMREWAPLNDVQRVLDVLLEQRQHLLESRKFDVEIESNNAVLNLSKNIDELDRKILD